MEPEYSFEIDSFEKVSLVLQDLQELIKSVSKLLEKIEELLQSFKSALLHKPAINFTGNQKRQTPNISNYVKNTIEQPTVSGLQEIAGLKSIKAALHTLMVLPRQQPQLYGNRTVSNSILLYGPPGTGKTRLVHGLAAESGATLHSVSVSDLLSSYVGETEKNIKEIFSYLRTSGQFGILFIDEVDGLCQKRCSSENDYSRRIKTELMCQMTKTEGITNLFIIAATNCPWDLDAAILRRFQKHIYVPLPNSEERLELFQLFTKHHNMQILTPPGELEELIETSKGFSGSDISGLVQDALDIPLTELQGTKVWSITDDGFYKPCTDINQSSVVDIVEDIFIGELKSLPSFSVRARPAVVTDFLEAAKRVQVTVKIEDLRKYEMFRRQ